MTERDRLKLASICPGLRLVVERILAAMEMLGYPMLVTDGARTAEEQMALFRKGRRLVAGQWVPMTPDRRGIVTNCDGVVKRSNHQVREDGYGWAVDCAFLVDGPDQDGKATTPSWDETHPWALYGQMGETLGAGRVVWGGRFASLFDGPHLEWRA